MSGRGRGGENKNSFKTVQREKKKVYQEYITKHEAMDGLRSGIYLQGKLRVNPKSRKNAFVTCAGLKKDVMIQDEVMMMQTGFRNRAIHGDIVVIEVLPESEWPSMTVRSSVDDEVTFENFLSGNALAQLEIRAGEGKSTDENALTISENKRKLWRPNEDVLQSFRTNETAPQEHSIDILAQRDPKSPKQPVAKVVFILDAKHSKTLVGALEVNDASTLLKPNSPLPENVSFIFFQPHEAVYPKLIIPRLALPESFIASPLEHLRLIFQADIADEWSSSSKMPYGHNVRSIGEAGSISAETAALLTEHSCNHGMFSDEMLQPLRDLLGDQSIDSISRSANWRIPEEEIARRRDLRSYRIFTIDPTNAKDLDDALHITPMNDGTFEVGVHIADVSYFLREGTALDYEAANRATSVYLVQRVIPMLPAILCEQLCSLNPNVDRLAFSCIFRMEVDGTLAAHHIPWFGRTVIRSCAKLDYATAQRMVDGEIPSKPTPSEDDPDGFLKTLPDTVWQNSRHPIGHEAWKCAQDVCLMHRIAMARRSIRKTSGALTLFGIKLTFELDSDGNPAGVSAYAIKESNQLVEEYMLLANALVAGKLLERVGQHAFLRMHSPPELSGLREVEAFAKASNLPFDTSSSKSIQESLNTITLTSDPQTVQVITALLTTPMKPAQYIVAGGMSSETWEHYALSIPYYTHFTSPIRRYADVCAHRLLEVAVNSSSETSIILEDSAHNRFVELADHCNFMKLNSQKAQRRSDAVFLAVHLKDSPINARAVVISLGNKSFTVLIPKYGIQDVLMLDEMPGVTGDLIDEAGKSTLKLVRISVDPITGRPPETVNNSRNIPNTVTFTGTLTLKIMTEIMVHMSAKMVPPPVDVRVSLIGPL